MGAAPSPGGALMGDGPTGVLTLTGPVPHLARWVSVAEACRLTGLDRGTVLRLIDGGRLPAEDISTGSRRHLRIPVAALIHHNSAA